MKLKDVKDKIDKYFNKISPDDLLKLSIKYGFKEKTKPLNK